MSKPTKKENCPTPICEAPTWKDKLWGVVKNSCCVFTLCSMILILINWMMGGEMAGKSIYVNAFLLLYPFSLCVATARYIRLSKSVLVWVKCVLHPLLCLGGILMAYLPYMTRNGFSAGQVLVHWVAFIAVYGITMLLVALLSKSLGGKIGKNKEGKKQETYVPLFSNPDGEQK